MNYLSFILGVGFNLGLFGMTFTPDMWVVQCGDDPDGNHTCVETYNDGVDDGCGIVSHDGPSAITYWGDCF